MSITAAPHGMWFARVEIREGGGVDDGGWGEPEPVYLEVVAWDDEGHAMVVNFEGGCLRRANEIDGFSGLATAFEKDAVGVSDGLDDDGVDDDGDEDLGEEFA
ncbi:MULTISPECIES: hypothetical protein [unclassified Streptomyces]|uniref:hypothetical protein n=1 Tax=unclassified Streptomyces TaxID=2593676 RepID=UPI0036E9B38D